MPTRDRPADRGDRTARAAARRLAEELRRARRGAGLSQAITAEGAGISRSWLSRVERGLSPDIPLVVFARVGAVVGPTVALKAFPDGDAIRDAAHARLLERFRRRLHPGLKWRTEVPLPIPGDKRSWDGVVGGAGWQDAVEAETGVDDAQALERRVMLKRRDGGMDHVILVIADTRRNRDALAEAPAAFAAFPLRTRQILASLRAGRHPGGSGIVLL
jgi:transcriptional regulator with XRE-family HTH domain